LREKTILLVFGLYKLLTLGEPLVQRKDDNEKTLKKRLDAFHSSTKPILQYYKSHNILEEIQADNSVENIWKDIQNRLG
jgi:adenylate kinase